MAPHGEGGLPYRACGCFALGCAPARFGYPARTGAGGNHPRATEGCAARQRVRAVALRSGGRRLGWELLGWELLGWELLGEERLSQSSAAGVFARGSGDADGRETRVLR
jgi:hypothetical protein